MSKTFKTDICIFLILWLFYSAISMINPVMPDWDWMNYYNYSAWAVLNDRFNVDFFVANSRTCVNPLCNLINYLLMTKLNNHPMVFFTLTSLDMSFLMFFAYKIINCLTAEITKSWLKNTFLIFSLLFVCYSPLVINESDFSRSDAFVGAFLLAGFYLFIKNYFNVSQSKSKGWLIASGVLFGVALGLKLSVYSYVVALAVLFFVFESDFKQKLKKFCLWGIGVFVAFFAVDGWWIAKCWSVFKNPLFPYFNNIFRSPFLESSNWLPNEYFSTTPRNIFEIIFCPILRGDDFVFFIENGCFEPRFGIVYFSLIILFVMCLIAYKKKVFEKHFGFINCKKLILVSIFVTVTYVFNLLAFGTNGRFLTGIFPLFGFFVVTLIFSLFKNFKSVKFFTILNLVIILIFSFCFSSVKDLSFWRKSTPKEIKTIPKLIEEPNLRLEDNSVVILLTQGTSFIVVNQNPTVKFVGFQIQSEIFDKYKDELYPLDLFLYSKHFPFKYGEEYMQDLILSDKKIYLLFNSEVILTVAQTALDSYNRNRSVLRKYTDCRPVTGKIFGTEYYAYEEKYICKFN